MAAISLPFVQQLLQMNDINRDGRLDVAEIANASIKEFAQGDQTGGSFFASLVQGGVDRRGLYPDYNGDQAIDANELAMLAGANGNPGAIDSGDLQAVFGTRYQGGGQGVDIQQLQNLAQTNISKFQAGDQNQPFMNSVNYLQQQNTGYYNDPYYNNPYGPPQGGGQGGNQQFMGQFMQIMMQMMQMMLSFMSRR